MTFGNFKTSLEMFADLNHQFPSSLSWTHAYRARTIANKTQLVQQIVIPNEDLEGKSYVYIGVRGLVSSSFSIRISTPQMANIASNQHNVGFIAPQDRQRFIFTSDLTEFDVDVKLIVSLDSAAPLKCFVSGDIHNMNPTEREHNWLVTPGNTLLVDAKLMCRPVIQ
ncbi:hypothetical protein GEMRC1_013150 [Eukaryota sp. GEM-RC1]